MNLGWRVLFVLIGLAVVGAGVHEAWMLARLRRHGVSAVGLVVRHRVRRSGRSTTYAPVVSFTDDHGVPREITGSLGGSSPKPAAGSEVPVRYLPDRPEKAQIDLTWYKTVGLALLFGVGGVFVLVPLFLG
jgi:Protein of unknown function (DUF3592)